jgi:hypothetical protein
VSAYSEHQSEAIDWCSTLARMLGKPLYEANSGNILYIPAFWKILPWHLILNRSLDEPIGSE